MQNLESQKQNFEVKQHDFRNLLKTVEVNIYDFNFPFKCFTERFFWLTRLFSLLNICIFNNLQEPKIEIDLKDKTIKEGEEVTFLCQMSGNPLPDVSWYREDELIFTNDIYNISENGRGLHVLKIGLALEGDDGHYEIRGRNSLGTVKSSAVLRIIGL